MAQKFLNITRPNLRKLKTGEKLTELGISFERLLNGDGRYTVNIMVDGIRIHRVIGKESEGVTREQAEKFIEQARTDARAGRFNLPKNRKTVFTLKRASEEYIAKLMTEGGKDLQAKQRRLNQHVIPAFGDKPLSQISTSDIESFKKKRKDEGAQNGTINRDLAALSHLLSKAIEWKWINNKPCIIRRLKEEPSRINYLTTDQIKRLEGSAKQDQHPHLYPFIKIALATGMRRMEILSIKIKNINLEQLFMHIPHAKAGPREQPITKDLAEFLQNYIGTEKYRQEWLFPSIASRSGHTVNIEKPFRRAVIAAGLDPKVVVRHTLRHTAITHLVQAGVDLPTVKRISGHKTLSMVERYSHQNGTHIQIAMDKLQATYSGIT